jgi:hypothetical protein
MVYWKPSTEEALNRSKVCREALHAQGIHALDKKNCYTTLQPRLHKHDLGETAPEDCWVVYILP